MIFLSLSVYFSLQHTYNILHDFDDITFTVPNCQNEEQYKHIFYTRMDISGKKERQIACWIRNCVVELVSGAIAIWQSYCNNSSEKKQTHYIWLCTLKVSNSCKWNIVKNKQNNRKKNNKRAKKEWVRACMKENLKKIPIHPKRCKCNIFQCILVHALFFKWRFTRRFSNLFENGM